MKHARNCRCSKIAAPTSMPATPPARDILELAFDNRISNLTVRRRFEYLRQ
jgi:hypothetical protein